MVSNSLCSNPATSSVHNYFFGEKIEKVNLNDHIFQNQTNKNNSTIHISNQKSPLWPSWKKSPNFTFVINHKNYPKNAASDETIQQTIKDYQTILITKENNNNNIVARKKKSGDISASTATVSTTASNMGAFLDKPKTEKTNSNGEGQGVRYAVAAMQGWRVDMEDAHVIKIGLGCGPLERWSFFGVFDGHAGPKVALYCAENLLHAVLTTDQFKKLTDEMKSTSSANNNGNKLTSKCIKTVEDGLRQGFLGLDVRMKEQPDIHADNDRSGTTAVCALLTPTHIFLANLGDSRGVLSQKDSDPIATEDHKPFLPKERERILQAGGSVMIQRVNGSLAVSRALGDYDYKSVPGLQPTQQLVSPEPDIYSIERNSERDEFLLLACDGIFDVMSNVELCDFVRSRLQVTDDLTLVSNQLLDACLSKGSRDNMSVVLIAFSGAPKVSNEAQKADAIWKRTLENKVREILTDEKQQDEPEEANDIDVEYVMRALLHSDIQGVPPGAGVHAARSDVEVILEREKKVQSTR